MPLESVIVQRKFYYYKKLQLNSWTKIEQVTKQYVKKTVCEKGADSNYYSSTGLLIPEWIISYKAPPKVKELTIRCLNV